MDRLAIKITSQNQRTFNTFRETHNISFLPSMTYGLWIYYDEDKEGDVHNHWSWNIETEPKRYSKPHLTYKVVEIDEFVEYFSFPKRWCVKITEDNICTIGSYYNEKSGATAYTREDMLDGYLSSHNISNGTPIWEGNCGANFFIFRPTKEFPEITTEQFINKFIQPQTKNQMKDFTVVGTRITLDDIKEDALYGTTYKAESIKDISTKTSGILSTIKDTTCVHSTFSFEGEVYVTYEREEYEGGLPYITKLSSFKNSESKPIGYKCPTDLFNGKVKAGTVFTDKEFTKGFYGPENEDRATYTVPKEIVETWEPVFKVTYPTFSLRYDDGVIEVSLKEEGILFSHPDADDLFSNIEEIEKVKSFLEGYSTKYDITPTKVDIGCKKGVDAEQLLEIICKFLQIKKK